MKPIPLPRNKADVEADIEALDATYAAQNRNLISEEEYYAEIDKLEEELDSLSE